MSKRLQIRTRMTKLVIKFQIQINIKTQKCKNRRETTCKFFSPKGFTIQPLEHKYFRSKTEWGEHKISKPQN